MRLLVYTGTACVHMMTMNQIQRILTKTKIQNTEKDNQRKNDQKLQRLEG